MRTTPTTSLGLAIGVLFVGSLSLHERAAADPTFLIAPLVRSVAGAGFSEGNCGEGNCGVAQMDTDKNGTVSKKEYEAAGGHAFDAADQDHDGELNAAEMKAAGHGVNDAKK